MARNGFADLVDPGTVAAALKGRSAASASEAGELAHASGLADAAPFIRLDRWVPVPEQTMRIDAVLVELDVSLVDAATQTILWHRHRPLQPVRIYGSLILGAGLHRGGRQRDDGDARTAAASSLTSTGRIHACLMRAPLIPAMKMLHRPRTRRPLAIARVALCVTTLLLQGTLVPLAHASHVGATATTPHPLACIQAEHVAPTHDAATCGLLRHPGRTTALRARRRRVPSATDLWSSASHPLLRRRATPPLRVRRVRRAPRPSSRRKTATVHSV